VDGGMSAHGGGFPALWAHMKSLWPRWTLLPAFPFVAWPAYCVARGEYRWELLLAVFLGAVMPYIGPRAKRLYVGMLPVGLVGLLYDSMRFVKNVGLTPARVHVCDLRDVEMRYFGVDLGGGHRGTLHDWVQAHPSLALDVFFSVPYGTFIGAAFLFAGFLYFADYPAMRRFMGAFLAMNIAAFVTYHLYPAAPPWYFHAHGCAVDLTSRASEGPNLARVDAWLGVSYFGGFYGRSNDVFGAVPSLHVAYPLLIMLEGWRPFGTIRGAALLKWPLRLGAAFFSVWMCVAAVYLDHHWVIDVLVGIGFALVAFAAFRGARWAAARRRGGARTASAQAAPVFTRSAS
jgi:membrane-associated phospholipid phosphatase